MSNLLNKNSKKKLLERGPQISPATQFKIDETEPVVEKPVARAAEKKEKLPKNKFGSVRVKKSTRDKLNALVSLNKADNVDELVDLMIEEYLTVHITKDEKKQLDIIMELYSSRN